MPHTLAHPGFSWWLKNRCSSLSFYGLTAGAVAPDLPLLFRWSRAHSDMEWSWWIRYWWFVLPAGVLLALYLRVVVPVYVRFWPTGDRHQYRRKTGASENVAPLWLLISVIAGILSHALLDAVTHPNPTLWMLIFGTFVSANDQWMYIAYYTSWYLPQVLATFAGLWLMVRFFTRRPVSAWTWHGDRSLLLFWASFGWLAAGMTCVRWAISDTGTTWNFPDFIVYVTAGIFIAFLLLPLFFLRKARHPSPLL